MLVEIWMLKVILMRPQVEMKNIGNWRKGESCYKVAKKLG